MILEIKKTRELTMSDFRTFCQAKYGGQENVRLAGFKLDK